MKKVIGFILIVIALGGFVSFVSTKCYNVGVDVGIDKALDTVNKMMRKQVDADTTTCTKVVFNDTLVYILSKKTIK